MNEMWTAGEITDKERILAFLETDRLYAAYAIGDLEPELFAECTWVGAEKDGKLRALGLIFRGLDPPALFLMGEPPGLRIILTNTLHPERALLTCRTEHRQVVEEFYAWERVPDAMWRMVFRKRNAPPPEGSCIRLTAAHAEQIRTLIAQGKIVGFAAAQIERGVFFGILEDNRLISIAGTHLISPTYGIAAIGNIITHPDRRGRGLATAAVGAVLAELVRIGIGEIVLNVRKENTPAIHVYTKLGFERYCEFFEGPALLRKRIAP